MKLYPLIQLLRNNNCYYLAILPFDLVRISFFKQNWNHTLYTILCLPFSLNFIS